MRAMVFGADADKLIVAATAAEVRRYAVGQPVEVSKASRHEAVMALADSGWDIVRKDEENPWRPLLSTPSSKPVVKCILRTLCGSTQERWAEYPGPHDFRFPIVEPVLSLAVEDNVTFRTRTFRRDKMRHYPSGAIEVTYLETV